MKVVFDHSEALTSSIRTFYFKPQQPVHYTAGQFTELTIPHKHPDDRGMRRWFTLSSSPAQELLTVTTRYAGDTGSSFKKAMFALEPGTELDFAEPMGDFVLPKQVQTQLVFVAGGIGITPFHSMLEWLAATPEKRPIKLLYAVRTEDDIIFQETFEKAGIHATIIVSEPSAAWGGERGRLTAEMVLGLEKPDENSLVYLSGPESMIEALASDLHKAGLAKHQIVTDTFPGYTGV